MENIWSWFLIGIVFAGCWTIADIISDKIVKWIRRRKEVSGDD